MNTLEKTLDQIGVKHGTDKSSKCHQFLDFYDTAFKEYRHKEIKILEIGIAKGNSITMLREYFTKAKIHATDYVQLYLDNIENKKLHNVKCNYLDQSKKEALEKYFDDHGTFDIIIDDGSHQISHQKLTFNVCMAKGLNEKGIYVLEDLHTSLSSQYVNSSYIDEEPTALDMLKNLQKEKTFDITIQETNTVGHPGMKSITSIIKRN
jgi:hypothetical protein